MLIFQKCINARFIFLLFYSFLLPLFLLSKLGQKSWVKFTEHLLCICFWANPHYKWSYLTHLWNYADNIITDEAPREQRENEWPQVRQLTSGRAKALTDSVSAITYKQNHRYPFSLFHFILFSALKKFFFFLN